jgi:glycopeptide antibiotics resistance protein
MSLVLFVFPQLVVRFLLGEPVWDKRIRLLIYGSVLPFLWYLLVPENLKDFREVNFLQHSLGGVSAGLVAIFFLNIFQDKFHSGKSLWDNFFVQLGFTYMCVSAFGVGNELIEFLFDWAGVGIFSADRYDVWFDLTANTVGAVLVFLLYRFFKTNFFRG